MSTTPGSGERPILVTGATGFTGGALAVELRRRGRQVRALTRPTSDTERLRDAGVELVVGDLLSRDDVIRAAEGVAAIYHIAAVFRTAGHPEQYYHDVNVGGTENVLAAARHHGVGRTVHCSTIGVHGHVSRVPGDETSPFNPGDVYQVTKLTAEEKARQAFADGLPGTIFRPGGIYGPGDRRFLKLFRTINERTFRMFGSGEVLYQMTYIDDLVAGIILCGEHPAAVGNTYILVGDEYMTLTELVRTVAGALGVRPPRLRLPMWPLMAAAVATEVLCRPFGIDPPLHRRRVEFFIHDRAFSNSKAKRELGFSPRVSTAEGVERTADWYIANGLLKPRARTSV